VAESLIESIGTQNKDELQARESFKEGFKDLDGSINAV
jgi:hypothetical protein